MKTTNGYRIMKQIQMCFLFIAICFGVQRVQGQSCFVQLGDATGMKFSVNDSIKLDSIATTFKNILPSAHQSDFKVFSAGIYWHAPLYTGINDFLEEILNSAITTYQGQYYVAFFIVKMQGGNTNWRVITRMNLPSQVYNCTEPYYNVLLNSLIQMDFMVNPKNAITPYDALAEQISESLKRVSNVVDHMLNCCEGFRSSECEVDIDPEELVFMLTSNGYSGFLVDSIEYTLNDTINHDFLKGDKFTAIRDDFTIDVLEDLGPFFDELDGVFSSFGGNSLYFNGSNFNDLMLQVDGSPPPSYQGNSNQRNSMESSYSSNGVINIDVIGVKINQLKMLFARTREININKEMNIPGKIYIVKAGTPINVNFDSVKHHVDNYMSLTQINVPTVLRLNGISETELNVRDAVAIVGGHMSKIVHLAQQNYCTLYHYDESFVSKLDRLVKCAKAKINPSTGKYPGEFEDCYYNPLEFAHAGNNIDYPGISEFSLYNKGGRIIIVPANKLNNNDLSNFKLSSKNELIGFLITHGSGHNAGIVHHIDETKDFHSDWIMGTGSYIKSVLNGQKIDLKEYLSENSEYNKKQSEDYRKKRLFLRKWIKTRFKSQ